jgi:ABC-type glycerol-3-phosphate transport system substrate-binding protein
MKKTFCVFIMVCALCTAAYAGGQAAGGGAADSSVVKVLGTNGQGTWAGRTIRLSDWVDGTVPSRLWEQFKADLAKRNVTLDLELIMDDQMQTFMQTVLASGRLNDYDFVNGGSLDDAAAQNLVNQKRILSWNQALEQYSEGPAREYFFNDEAGQFFRKMVTLEDGNFYWVNSTQEMYYIDPANGTGSHRVSQIRWDWIQALGLGFPTTLDEFYNALVLFQEQDMNKNGVKDEVAQVSLTGFDTGIAQWFGLGTDLVSIIDYKAVSPWYQPAVRDYISYLNKLYKAGLLKVDSEGGARQANRIGYIYEWTVATWHEPNIIIPDGALKPYYANFILRALPTTPERVWVQGAQGRVLGGGRFFIPAGAKNPAGAVRIMDFQVTPEYALLSERGIEGYTFNYDSNGNLDVLHSNPNGLGLDIEMIAATTSLLYVYNIIPRHMMTDMQYYIPLMRSQGYPLKGEWEERALKDTWPYIQELSAYLTPPRQAETTRTREITPDLNTYSSELLTALIMGEKSLNDWNTYMADLKRLGLDELTAIYQARIDRGR